MISFCTGQSGQHAHTRRALDFYSTPAIAVEALLQAEQFTPATRVWEPAAGDGAITHVLRVHGFPVICSDIVERAFPLHFTGDFLTQSKAPEAVTTIVTNPPFRQAQRFAEHSISLVPDVFLLLRLAFLESVRRTDLLEHRGLCAVHVFRRRLPRMHRYGWDGRRSTSSIAFAWFHWRAGFGGPPILNRI